MVSVRTKEADQYRRQGMISPVMDEVGEWMGAYDPVCGIITRPEHLDTLVV